MEHLPNHTKEDRPWGNFEQFTKNQPSTVKILTVRAGEAFSLQTHAHREEYWRVVSGSGTVTVGTQVRTAEAGADFFIPQGTAHRIEASSSDIVVLEIAFGNFDEDDIVRLKDKYGR